MKTRRRNLGDVRRLGWARENKRLSAGLTRAALAKAAGTSPAYLARIEKGEVDPRLSLMCKLASSLGWVIR